MSRPYSRVLERLRQAGLRPTRQRMALAKLLFDKGDCHVSAEQLHGQALNARIRVSLATVYNTLHQFTETGLMREIIVDASRVYFDTNTSDHHHFFFEDSHELQDIDSEAVAIAVHPEPPKGTSVKRVDVVIRLNRHSNS